MMDLCYLVLHTDQCRIWVTWLPFALTFTFSFTFGAGSQSCTVLSRFYFIPLCIPSMTKGQENLLVIVANRIRVDGLTLPNFLGSMRCAAIMECLTTIFLSKVLALVGKFSLEITEVVH